MEPDETPVDVPPLEERIAATELAKHYDDVAHGLARVVALGLYEPVDAATYRVADAQLVRVVDRLVGVGLPADAVLGELERLKADSERIARRTVELFHRTAWAAYQNSERGSEDLAVLAEQLATTRSVAAATSAELIERFITMYLDGDTELSEVVSGA
jgi:hypothetical protein